MTDIAVWEFCELFTEPLLTQIAIYDIGQGINVWQGDAQLKTLHDDYKTRKVESVDAPDKYGVLTINVSTS